MSIPKTIGRYEIVDELGHGAMGSVFRARDPAMDRIVALKTIRAVALASEQSSEFRERFYREARAAGALAHPGIVPVFDVGEHDGVPFLVMEFVNGQTLAQAMKKRERPSLDRVCEIGQQVADALGYAHRNGVIHRDIKPPNILITSREVYGVERPKITDFGVAKIAAGAITTTGQFLGTPAFMPPEQFIGGPIDGRTDLFSLGVILYWMATGEQPFSGETMTAVSYKIVQTEPIPPAKLNPAIPAAFERVILKCLAKDPAERYQTGEGLAEALGELRTSPKTSGLQALAPVTVDSDDESKATLDSAPSAPAKSIAAPVATPAAETSQPAMPPPMKKQPAMVPALLAATGAIVLIALAASGGYMLRHRSRSVPHQLLPSAAPAAAAQAPGQTAAGTSPNAESAIAKPSAAAPATPVATPAPRTRSAFVAFNPRTLDPRQNTRLKIDLEHFPPGLAVTIEMNGKTYVRGSAGNKSDYSNLFVPPGVQEFRVAVSRGSLQKISNTVSAEFIAKKRMTLRVEIRTPSKGAAASSAGLDPTAQVIAMLKSDRFPL